MVNIFKFNSLIQLIFGLLFLFCQTTSTAADTKWHFSTNEKIVSVGDIHGDYNAFVSIMQKAKLLDANHNWSGGKTHFVNTGDFLDRGPDSRKVMDLLIKLEKQAVDAGGKIYVLLGNHEVMNLIGDRRYIAIEEYAAFQSEESPEMRSHHYQQFIKLHRLEDGAEAQVKFSKVYSPGYFGLHAAFSQEGYYGSWLKNKPFIIVINGQVFTHGGLSTTVGKLGLKGINVGLNDEMNEYASLWYSLIDAGLYMPYMNKDNRIEFAKSLVEGKIINEQLQRRSVVKKAKKFLAVAETIINKPESPVWYRGTALCHQFSEQPLVDRVLSQLGATSAFLGHSVTNSHEVESRFGGRVFLQDTGMLKKAYKGQASLVIHTKSGNQVFDEKHGLHEIAEQSFPRYWYRPYGMTNEQLEQFLLTAEITASKEIGLGISKPKKLTLKKGNRTIHALYKNIDSYPKLEKSRSWPRKGNFADRYHNDIAAYELNKLLGLNLVPPSVERKYNGKNGVFQYWIENATNRSEMIAKKIPYKGYCKRSSQIALTRVWDALIYNEDRNTGNIVFQKDQWQLWLIDHTRSFTAKKSLPKGMKWSKLKLSNSFRKSIASLNREDLDRVLSKYLHKNQISFILKRRDKILAKVKKEW